jgi:hypothetical protein
MKELLESNLPDTPTPLNSTGGYKNAAGSFPIARSLKRKVKSRDDLSQPKGDLKEEYSKGHLSGDTPPHGPQTTTSGSENNATDRYFGSFSIDSKRHVRDLLAKHPMFSKEGTVRLIRTKNNTRDVLHNDPVKIVNNGGSITYQKP